jgi:hypothetical protein
MACIQFGTDGWRGLIADESPGGSLVTSLVLKNTINCGNSFHLQAQYWDSTHRFPICDGAHWFLVQNSYVNTNKVPVSPVWSPTNLPVQYQP